MLSHHSLWLYYWFFFVESEIALFILPLLDSEKQAKRSRKQSQQDRSLRETIQKDESLTKIIHQSAGAISQSAET